MGVLAGYNATVYRSGAAVSMTGEACTSVSGSVYRITNSAKRVLDPASAQSVIDNGTPLSDSAVHINFATGVITKVSGSFTGPVTVTGSYLPLLAEANASSFEISADAELIDDTVMSSTTEFRSRGTLGLRDISGSVTIYDVITDDADPGGGTVTLEADFQAGTRRIFKIVFSDGTGFAAFVKLESLKENTGDLSQLTEATYAWRASSDKSSDTFGANTAYWGTF